VEILNFKRPELGSMKWQEYQDAVGKLYDRVKEMGEVKRNFMIPDKETGSNRQVDAWWQMRVGGHQFNTLIDAKMRSEPLDVKDVEEVIALANAVNADKAIIVTNSGINAFAAKKAELNRLDIRIFSIEDALDLIVPDKWLMCYDCNNECVVMDWDGVLYREDLELFFYWQAGRCRECRDLYIYCPECGGRKILEDSDPWECGCGHRWKTNKEQLFIKFNDKRKYLRIDKSTKVSAAFINWLLRLPHEHWHQDIVGQLYRIGTDTGGRYDFIITGN
jgi:hypothetical protein